MRARGPLVWLLAVACAGPPVQALVDALIGDIERLRAAPLPEPK